MDEAQASTKQIEAEPETLLEAVVYFQNPDNCITYLAAHRCNDGVPVCPTCGSKDVGFIASRRMFQCKTRHPKAQFSIDRKSTRLNSSHLVISYAVFCL